MLLPFPFTVQQRTSSSSSAFTPPAPTGALPAAVVAAVAAVTRAPIVLRFLGEIAGGTCWVES